MYIIYIYILFIYLFIYLFIFIYLYLYLYLYLYIHTHELCIHLSYLIIPFCVCIRKNHGIDRRHTATRLVCLAALIVPYPLNGVKPTQSSKRHIAKQDTRSLTARHLGCGHACATARQHLQSSTRLIILQGLRRLTHPQSLTQNLCPFCCCHEVSG